MYTIVFDMSNKGDVHKLMRQCLGTGAYILSSLLLCWTM